MPLGDLPYLFAAKVTVFLNIHAPVHTSLSLAPMGKTFPIEAEAHSVQTNNFPMRVGSDTYRVSWLVGLSHVKQKVYPGAAYSRTFWDLPIGKRVL